MKANVVSIVLRDCNFISNSRQRKIEYTNAYDVISKNIIELFKDNYTNGTSIRYICVGVSGLKENNVQEQLDIFSIVEENKSKKEIVKRKEKVTKTMDKLKEIYGSKIDYASTITTKIEKKW